MAEGKIQFAWHDADVRSRQLPARPGSKHHILVDASGMPVSAILTGANHHDVTQLLPLVDAIPPIRGVRDRPLQTPKVLYADRGYDSDSHRQKLRQRGIKAVIAKCWIEHGSGPGKFRWAVERNSRLAPQLARAQRPIDWPYQFLQSICEKKVTFIESLQNAETTFLPSTFRPHKSPLTLYLSIYIFRYI